MEREQESLASKFLLNDIPDTFLMSGNTNLDELMARIDDENGLIELQDLNKVSKSRIELQIPDDEWKRIEEWKERHFKKCKFYTKKHGIEEQYTGAIGGTYTYCVTPTSIGTVVKAKCACGEEFDATDYGCW